MKYQALDIVIILLTVTVCGALGASIADTIVAHEEVDLELRDIFTGIISSMLAILSMYVGAMIQKKADRKE